MHRFSYALTESDYEYIGNGGLYAHGIGAAASRHHLLSGSGLIKAFTLSHTFPVVFRDFLTELQMARDASFQEYEAERLKPGICRADCSIHKSRRTRLLRCGRSRSFLVGKQGNRLF
jgi:hypothetical protein